MYWFHYVGKALTRIALLVLASWHVNGKENVPRQGPLLVVANHLNLADPPIISTSLGRKAIFMAKQELFHSLPGYFVRSFGAFPVRRGGFDRRALEEAQAWLGKGVAVVMFPEGSRSLTARLQPAFPGSALIASRVGVPILPVGITGTEKIKGSSWWLRRPKITVNIGRPFNLPPADGRTRKEELSQYTESIMKHIAELLPAEYRAEPENQHEN
ncbi:MAG: lysophospholipid acyltransferase family protein [Dehalococcoidales bacterium]|nr:lysophospholipid acyltransferase family protein [Dehalococcoidales bacterium]